MSEKRPLHSEPEELVQATNPIFYLLCKANGLTTGTAELTPDSLCQASSLLNCLPAISCVQTGGTCSGSRPLWMVCEDLVKYMLRAAFLILASLCQQREFPGEQMKEASESFIAYSQVQEKIVCGALFYIHFLLTQQTSLLG